MDRLLDTQLSQTLGPLSIQLRQLLGEDFTPADAVSRALVTRNYLVHHFWRTRSLSLATEHGRAKVAADLGVAQQEIFSALEAVMKFAEEQRAAAGLSDESLLATAMEAMTDEAGNLDASWFDLPAAEWPTPPKLLGDSES